MFIKLTLVWLDKKKNSKEQVSTVQQQRVNFKYVKSYFEANPEQMNHPSEHAKFNTVLDFGPEVGCFWAKETVEEIDRMLSLYGQPLIGIYEPIKQPENKSDIFDKPSPKEDEWK